MTTQTCLDTFIYNGERYELFESEGGKLIEPQDYDMNPECGCSNCWRGFDSAYEINSEGLFLTAMTIYSEVKEGYKSIGGIEPETYDDEWYGSTASYRNLRLLTPFTGKLRLSKDLFAEIYDFVYDYGMEIDITVMEITLEKGRLISVEDIGIVTLSSKS